MRNHLSNSLKRFKNTMILWRKRGKVSAKWDSNSKKSTCKIQRTMKKKFNFVLNSSQSSTTCTQRIETLIPNTNVPNKIWLKLYRKKKNFKTSCRNFWIRTLNWKLKTPNKKVNLSLCKKRLPARREILSSMLNKSKSLMSETLNWWMIWITSNSSNRSKRRTWQRINCSLKCSKVTMSHSKLKRTSC